MSKTKKYLIYSGVLIIVFILIQLSLGANKKTESNSVNVVAQEKESQKKNEAEKIKPAEKIQVFVFHSTNRCYSCITMGQLVKKTVEQKFSEELKSGKIEFREINVDLPENKEVVNKFKAVGSSLFINPIIDGRDNIQEDTQTWRLLSSEQGFINYLSDKLKVMLGSEISTQTEVSVKKEDITFYSSDNCYDCANIEKYFMENDIKNKIGYDEKNIDKNEADFEQMAEDAAYCDINIESFDVPFLWAQGKCYTNEKDIINFFNQKIN